MYLINGHLASIQMLILIAAELNSNRLFGSVHLKVGRLNQSYSKVAPAGLGEKNGSGIPNCFRLQTFHVPTVIKCIRFGS